MTDPFIGAGVYLDVPEDEYHSAAFGPDGGALSSSGAKALLKSPAHYQWQKANRRTSDAFDVGQLVHAKVLGVGAVADIACNEDGEPFTDWRTKAAREFRDASRAAGRIPILEHEYKPVEAMAEAVLAHPIARALLERPGVKESSLYAQDPTTGVWLRGRLDHLDDPSDIRTIIGDLKSGRSADPREFHKAAIDHGYDLQDVWYPTLLTLARGDENPAFVFIVVESTAPHFVSVIELDVDFRTAGKQRMRAAINRYAECMESGEWPAYGSEIHHVNAPYWYALQTEEQYAS